MDAKEESTMPSLQRLQELAEMPVEQIIERIKEYTSQEICPYRGELDEACRRLAADRKGRGTSEPVAWRRSLEMHRWFDAMTKDRCDCVFETQLVTRWIDELLSGKPYIPGPGASVGEPSAPEQTDALYGKVISIVNQFALAGHIGEKGVTGEACQAIRAALSSAAPVGEPPIAREEEPTAAIAAGRNTLRWLLNLTTDFDRKDVRTRQAARLLDEYGDGQGNTNRQLLEAMWSALASGAAPSTPTDAARDVLAERKRQQEVEGWTHGHDDGEHDNGELERAAAAYAYPELVKLKNVCVWPWGPDWWKPKDERSNLVKAGALILAAIERRDRASDSPLPKGEST